MVFKPKAHTPLTAPSHNSREKLKAKGENGSKRLTDVGIRFSKSFPSLPSPETRRKSATKVASRTDKQEEKDKGKKRKLEERVA